MSTNTEIDRFVSVNNVMPYNVYVYCCLEYFWAQLGLTKIIKLRNWMAQMALRMHICYFPMSLVAL